MADTINTAGLSQELRDLIFFWLSDDNWVPCTEDISGRKSEMIKHFGSPRPAGYMSEEEGWLLDDDDAAAIRDTE
jgi:hypothetical protein